VALSFVADENVETEVVAALRGLGHEVTHAAETDAGQADDSLLGKATEQGRVLVTHDKDFGDLVFRQRRSSCGVILMRLPGRSADIKARLVAQAVVRYGEALLGAFLVIGSRTMRLRRIPE
jgi:predicted nuclease of predicted toxin-antitoxin system